MLNGDQLLYAGWEAFSYLVEGNASWNGNDAGDLSLTVTRSRSGEEAFDLFTGIVFNGQEVSKTYYTAEKGSVKLTIKSELFDGLASGEYELAVRFADGEVKVAVTVEQKQEQTPAGDNGILPWLLLAVSSILSIAAVCAYGRKRRNYSF